MIVVMQPVVERRTRAGESRNEEQQNQHAGENRFTERAQRRCCSPEGHVSELHLQTFIAASLFPAEIHARPARVNIQPLRAQKADQGLKVCPREFRREA